VGAKALVPDTSNNTAETTSELYLTMIARSSFRVDLY